MVRINLYILLFILLFSSCVNSQKKELCFDDNTYKLIDTSAFYLKYHKIATYPTLKPTQRGIKFYKNGKVIEFNDYPNNKNAEGTYCINSHNSEMKIYYKHVQGNFWSVSKLEFKNDTLISNILPSPQTKGYSVKYIKVRAKN